MPEYPTVEELERVKKWDVSDPAGLMEFIETIWWMPSWGYRITGKSIKRLQLHTGGWSGNEDIIEALEQNMFWALYWDKSTRGGHYYFVIRPFKKEGV